MATIIKRGDDDINLDDVSKDVLYQAKLDLADHRIKEELRALVLADILSILEGLYNNSFSYRPSGGFTNNLSKTNLEGFDSMGLAAGFVGEGIRRANKYVKEDTRKQYSQAAFKNYIQEQLLGGASINDFIDLDRPVNGVRGTDARVKVLLSVLSNLYNTGNDYFKDIPESVLTDLQTALAKFEDDKIEENERYYISKVTGLDNLDRLLYTGADYGEPLKETPATETPETPAPETPATQITKEDWLELYHPRIALTSSLSYTIGANAGAKYDQQGRKFIALIMQKVADPNLLLAMVNEGLKYPPNGTQLSQSLNINDGKGRVLTVTNEYLIAAALNELINRNSLTDLGNRNWLLGDSPDGEILVYQATDKGNIIKSADPYDYKHYQDKWDKDFNDFISVHKEGGVIRKFGSGNSFTTITTDKPLTYNELTNVVLDENFIKALENNISLDGLADYARLIKELVTLRNLSGINSFSNGRTQSSNELMGMANNFYLDHFSFLNYLLFGNTALDYNDKQGIAYNYAEFNRPTVPSGRATGDRAFGTDATGPNNNDYRDANPGAQSFMRVVSPTDSSLKDLKDLGDWGKLMKARGALGAYYYKEPNSEYGMWVPYLDETKVPLDSDYISFGKSNFDKLALDTAKENDKKTYTGIEDSENDKKTYTGIEDSDVDETYLPDLYGALTTNKWKSLWPDLLEGSRLFGTLINNRESYKTLRNSLNPVLKTGYDVSWPIYGKFSYKLAASLRAAELENNPATTSDSYRELASSLERWKTANLVRKEAFLVDDNAILDNILKAVEKSEERKKVWNDVAFWNRSSINQTNREKASLKSSYIKKNWSAIDNYLSGVETRLRDKFKTLQEESDAYFKELVDSDTKRWYEEKTSPAKLAYAAYLRTDEGKNDPTGWKLYDSYNKFIEDAQHRMQQRALRLYALRFPHILYSSQYTDEGDKIFKWQY